MADQAALAQCVSIIAPNRSRSIQLDVIKRAAVIGTELVGQSVGFQCVRRMSMRVFAARVPIEALVDVSHQHFRVLVSALHICEGRGAPNYRLR